MILNISSRILLNIILPEIEIFFNSLYESPSIAVSPVMNYQNKFFNYNYTCMLKISAGKKTFLIDIFSENYSGENIKLFNEWLQSRLYNIKAVLNILLNRNFNIELVTSKKEITKKEGIESKARKRIDLSIKAKKNNAGLFLIIPFDFLRLFAKRIDENSENNFIEDGIVEFFINPYNMFPHLKTILETFNDMELQKLLYKLQNKNLLTTYQICLLVMSYPEHSLRIKRNISKNTIEDVTFMINRLTESKKITKRDLIEGIYSIEEAIYMLMKNDEDISFSRFLSQIQKRLNIILKVQKLLAKDFSHWIKEISDSDLLYQTISITKDTDISRSISDKPDVYYDILIKYISKRKLKTIQTMIEEKGVSFTERIESQYNFISNYRKIKIKRLNPGPDSFKIMLSKIRGTDTIKYILLGVGWFVLSTALKSKKPKKQNEKRKIINMFNDAPLGARYLIIDVLQGIVNPNIIHDEIQINNARKKCVKEITSLYEEGIISLF